MEQNNSSVILYTTEDGKTQLDVKLENETVWLNSQQLSVLFGRDIKTIGKHINNALKEELAGEVVVAKFATTTRHGAMEGKTQTQLTEYYYLEMITSIGYRVKSKHGIQFRKWANSVLKQYLIQGYALSISSGSITIRSSRTWCASCRVPSHCKKRLAMRNTMASSTL